MLSKKQKAKLDEMVKRYHIGIVKSSKAPTWLIDSWVKRYRIAMEQVLQKRCKR